MVKVIRENSKFRILWDSLILILIIATCILIPFQLAFQHVVLERGTIVLFVLNLFFIIDIVLNFFTSYRYQGVEVTHRKKTAAYYLKTFFIVDLIANFPFDLLMMGFADVKLQNISIVVIFRLFRLLRIVRLSLIFRRWEAMGRTNSGVLRISKFFLIVLILIHWISCVWYLSAFLAKFPEDCWAVRAGIVGAGPVEQYVRSLYWAITTMTTVGYGDITPVRKIEYIISMFVMLSGASLYAFMIGTIASLFSKIDSAKVSHCNRIEAVTQYLHNRQVPRDLNSRIRNYYEYMWAQHRGVQSTDYFNELPDPLRLEVLLHVAKDLLDRVPLFKYASPVLRNALLMTLIQKTYSPEDRIVRQGEIGKEIYFISKGRVGVRSDASQDYHHYLEDGDYFGHLSLVLKETRTASAIAVNYCEVFLLTFEDFNRIKQEYPEFKDVLKNMAAENTDKKIQLIKEGIIL